MSEPNDKLNQEGFDPTTKLSGTHPKAGPTVDELEVPGEDDEDEEELEDDEDEDGGMEISDDSWPEDSPRKPGLPDETLAERD